MSSRTQPTRIRAVWVPNMAPPILDHTNLLPLASSRCRTGPLLTPDNAPPRMPRCNTGPLRPPITLPNRYPKHDSKPTLLPIPNLPPLRQNWSRRPLICDSYPEISVPNLPHRLQDAMLLEPDWVQYSYPGYWKTTKCANVYCLRNLRWLKTVKV